jgi:hypothetical protein
MALFLSCGPTQADEQSEYPEGIDIKAYIEMSTELSKKFKSEKVKAELLELKKFFESIEGKFNSLMFIDDTVMNGKNSTVFYCSMMRLFLLECQASPNDFFLWEKLSVAMISLYQSAKTMLDLDGITDKDIARPFFESMKTKGLQLQRELIVRFPDNPKAYCNLARSVYTFEHDGKAAVELVHKCLDVDKKNKECLDLLEILMGSERK